jgi:transcriptional regulator with XRE-family HTH domain
MRAGISSVGKRIRDTREARRISQHELADLLGISAAAVCQWETKGTIPRAKTLKKVAHALGVSEEYLSTGSEAVVSESGLAGDESVAAHIERAKKKIAEATGVEISQISLKITFEG